jgi:DNA helicase-2/ATP-dependent DNA helicase PcrA
MKSSPPDDLTPAQRTAVSHRDGAMLVLAGPGSGKTRVITHRIAGLIAGGVPPGRILAVTFTNKAADEMKSRLSAMGIPKGATICTFHSLCARLLREFADRAGLPGNFVIYDQSDQKAILRAIFKDLNLESPEFPPAVVLREIAARSDREGESRDGLVPSAAGGRWEEICGAYRKRLAAAGALDFDGLLVRTARLLRTDGEIRERLGRRYRYILVDEYQDTNACQYRIARELARDHGNLFVTGDPDQSIYGWRGADIGNILAFEKDYPGARVVRLEENFRSSPEVLGLADELIRANSRRKEKRLIPRRPAGSRPLLLAYADEQEEARGAAAWVRAMHDGRDVDYGRMAIFYRVNAMSRLIEESLILAGLPYRIVKGLEFFERREVKDVLAYLRLIANPADETSLVRIVNRPARGLGEKTIDRLARQAREAGADLWSVFNNPAAVPDISPAAIPRLAKFAELVEGLRTEPVRPVADLVRAVYERSGLRALHSAEEDRDATENVEELVRAAASFDGDESAPGGVAEFLQRTALVSDADAYREGSGAVSLMTLHTAKGLEFEAVLIVGCEDGLIPHARSGEDGRDLEEERRLLFVGITRAERFLALSHAWTRRGYGSTKPASLSVFLRGLTGLERVVSPFLTDAFGTRGGRMIAEPVRPAAGRERPSTGPTEAEGPFVKGRRIRHPALGTGLIENAFPGGTAGRAVVLFDRGGRLTLDLSLAGLEPLD